MSFSKIFKRNRHQRLGRYNRQLVIRLSQRKNPLTPTVYHLVLTRRRCRVGARYDKLGFIEIFKTPRKSYNIFGVDRNKIKQALFLGASFHVSVYKLLLK